MPTFKMLPTLSNLRKLERLQKKIVTIEEFHAITGLCNRIHFYAITIAFLSCKLLNNTNNAIDTSVQNQCTQVYFKPFTCTSFKLTSISST